MYTNENNGIRMILTTITDVLNESETKKHHRKHNKEAQQNHLLPMVSGDQFFLLKKSQSTPKLLRVQFQVLCQIFFSHPLSSGIKTWRHYLQLQAKQVMEQRACNFILNSQAQTQPSPMKHMGKRLIYKYMDTGNVW